MSLKIMASSPMLQPLVAKILSRPVPSLLLLSFSYNFAKILYKDYVSPRSLTGKVVVITGAGSGIGKEMSLKFAKVRPSFPILHTHCSIDLSLLPFQTGCVVVLLDLAMAPIREVQHLIESTGGKAHAYVCDVTSSSTVYSVASDIEKDVGEVWGLINNAGIVSGKNIFDVPDGLASKTLAVNTEVRNQKEKEPHKTYLLIPPFELCRATSGRSRPLFPA